LKLEKTASIASGIVGNPIVYTFKITNTGTGTVIALALNDPISTSPFTGAGTLPAITTATCTYKGAAVTLANVALPPISQDPLAIVTCVLPAYTAAALDAGKTVTNTATVSGRPAIRSLTGGYTPKDALPVVSPPATAPTVITAQSSPVQTASTGGGMAGVPGGLIGLASILVLGAAVLFSVRWRYARG